MTKMETMKEILQINNSNILLQLPTSFGKTRFSLEILKKRNPKNILIVVPRLVLINNWKDEMTKWGCKEVIKNTVFTTYVSLPKHAGSWDMVIFDEVQHLSERCMNALDSFTIKYSVLLSATVKRELLYELKLIFKDLYSYKVSMKKAIEELILPDPKVYLIPLLLDNSKLNCTLTLNPKGKLPVKSCNWFNRWGLLKEKKYKVEIACTEEQYIYFINNKIEYWKRRYMISHNDIFKNMWLHQCSKRLTFLAERKNSIVKEILGILDKERTLTFCNNIKQTEELGTNCINSKNANSSKILDRFNKGKINHITACNMLNEGINLTNCRVGIYANLNSSEIIIKQRLGRILRHNSPIIVIPYYENTRDVDLVNKMLEDYNPKLIVKSTINSLKEIV